MPEYPNETIQVLEERRSVRAFVPDSITEEERKIITSAALRAPNGGKMSKFSLIDVRDRALKEKIAAFCDNQRFVATAPGVYIVLADYSRWFRLFRKYVKTLGVAINIPREDEILLSAVDALLAAENMVIAAQSLGIGSCFIADIIINYRQVKELFALPKYVMPVTLCIFGRSAEPPRERTVRIDAPVVHRDRYTELPDDRLLDMIRPLIPRGANGKPVMSEEEYVGRYYVRRLGSWLSFERARNVHEMFEDWLKSPYEEQ